MIDLAYGDGDWWGVAVPEALVLLPPEVDALIVNQVRAALVQHRDLAAVLAVLSVNRSVLELPPFAYLQAGEGAAHLLLRGLLAETDDMVVDGRDVLTWAERPFMPPSTIRLQLQPGSETEAGLLVRDGVVRCGVAVVSLHAPSAECGAPAEASIAEGEDDQDSTAMVPTSPQSTGSLILPDGAVQPLDRPIVVGRRPSARGATAPQVHLIAVDSPGGDVSRRHIEVRPEGQTAVVVDLATSNGTTLRRAGRLPRRLTARQAQVLLDQDVIDLGGGVLLRYVAPATQL